MTDDEFKASWDSSRARTDTVPAGDSPGDDDAATFSVETTVRGLQYYEPSIAAALKPGTELRAEPEPSNKYDSGGELSLLQLKRTSLPLAHAAPSHCVITFGCATAINVSLGTHTIGHVARYTLEMALHSTSGNELLISRN